MSHVECPSVHRRATPRSRLAGGSPTGRRVRQAATLRSGKLAVAIPLAPSSVPAFQKPRNTADVLSRVTDGATNQPIDGAAATGSERPQFPAAARAGLCALGCVSARGGRAGSRPRAVTRVMAFRLRARGRRPASGPGLARGGNVSDALPTHVDSPPEQAGYGWLQWPFSA